jgi:hypothetical protein
MPFGPVNGPSTFIAFIHDMDGTWKDVARSLGIVIDKDMNTTIILDDIISWAKQVTAELLYMECQLCVCQSQNLSLSRKKSHIFPKQFEFVGVNVSPDCNCPAMSKHSLLHHWPSPELVQNVAKFVGFAQFYSRFISQFEQCISALRDIIKNEYTDPVYPYWMLDAKATFLDICSSILNNPCLKRYNHCLLLVLQSDFSSDGFGFVALQPGDDTESRLAMKRRMEGGKFNFMDKSSKWVLHPVAFGCCRTRGNKKWLHLHLGEAFSGNNAINKCRHMCFGQRFTWVTDCYALKFILSYDSCNSAILRLQMRFMCRDMDIEHRNDFHLVDADYWSWLGADLCFEPLLKDYIQRADFLRKNFPSPSKLPMLPQNQPYYRPPRNPPSAANAPSAAMLQLHGLFLANNDGTKIIPFLGGGIPNIPDTGMQYLSNWPVSFGDLPAHSMAMTSTVCSLYISDLTAAACSLSCFDWAVYGFNSGHFISSICTLGLPFAIVLASDDYAHGRSLFTEVSACTDPILGGCHALLDHVKASRITSKLSSYLIHSKRFNSTEPTSQFWQLQAAIITQFRITRSLSIVAAFVHPNHNSRAVSHQFITRFKSDGWLVSNQTIRFIDFGDSIADSCRLIVAVHSHTEEKCSPQVIIAPPPIPPNQLSSYQWAPFNQPESALSYSRGDKSFNNHAFNDSGLPPLIASDPPNSHNAAAGDGVSIKYSLHCIDANPTIKPGSYVVNSDGLCPRLNHVTTPIFSATTLVLNLIMRGTIMCAPSPHLN